MNETMNEKILIVDDEESLCMSLKLRLQANGFQTETAHNGFEALEKLTFFKADAVLLDVNMPVMDGVTTLGHIVERFPSSEVIMMTGFADFPTAIECLKKGAIDYLVKPIEVAELIIRIRTSLRAQKSERKLVELKQQYIATFIHDVLGPMKMVDDTISNLLSGGAGNITKEQALVLRQVNDLTRKMTSRIGDFFDITQLDASKFVLQKKPVDLTTLLQTVCLRHEILSSNKSLTFIKSIPQHLPYIDCDYDMISWVFHTLLDYGIKFSLSSGNVFIECVQSMFNKKEAVKVSIKEEGVGIEPEIVPLVLNPSHEQLLQMPSTTQTMVFDLLIAKYIIEAHGGALWLDANVVRENTFSFVLPT